jgi:predicted MFS family arabinose efflux permease
MSLVAGLGMFILALFPFSADAYLVPITFMFLPVAWSPLIIVGTALVSKISSLSQGAALGIFTSVTAMASLIAALSAGFVADNIGFIYVLLLSAAFTIASVVLMFLVKTGLNDQQEQTA